MASRVSISRGTNKKPAASDALVKFFSDYEGCSGQLMIGYPIIGTAEGRYPIDAILVSPEKGIVVFDLIEGTDPDDFGARQDDSANKLEARLKTYRALTERRNLLVEIHTLSFAPGIPDVMRFKDDDYSLTNEGTLASTLDGLDWENRNETVYNLTLSAIQSISTIRKSRTVRTTSKEDSRGAKLKRLEDSIATLDNRQSQAVIETVKGVQRIRGLAGSGKTIVLALKAAYLHIQHPDWRIAVTFNTRSLKGQFRRFINNFSVEQAGEEPDWEKVSILNAWGAPGGADRTGIYYEFCRAHDIQYFDLSSARTSFGRGREFAGSCEDALGQMQVQKVLYDVILVDEAQDFPPTFLRLCYEMLNEDKRLVFAYDELQNLSGEALPSPEEIFGKNTDGTPRVHLESPQEDIILEKCYRNSRPVLTTAHSLGFGIYRKPTNGTGLVQMFDHPQLWKDIGYELTQGELTGGKNVTLRRTPETSPEFLEDHSPIDDLIQFHQFANDKEQVDWLVKEIQLNLSTDELRYDDIVVINPDPLTTRSRVGRIRRQLLELNINSHLAGVDTDPDIFFQTNAPSITFTGIYRAKGNEAGMIYILNAQDCDTSGGNLGRFRNRLFTAISRSKAWVRVLGVGAGMERLTKEFVTLKTKGFELSFRYPTEAERQQMMIIHRDMTREDKQTVESAEQGLARLFEDLESGRVHMEDLDQDLLERLRKFLSR
ncbi:DEAD/DEAH box helicase [Chloroflexota bacterium]